MNAEFVEFTLLTLITGAAARTVTVLLYSVVPPDWSLTVTALPPDVPLGTQENRASEAPLEIIVKLAQSATASASVPGRLLPSTWK